MKNILRVIFILVLIIPIFVQALDYPSLNSKIVEVYDLTDDNLIYEDNSDKRVSIASLTKIVTTITSIESIKDLDEQVIITQEFLNTVRWDASRAGLKNGDKVTYRDLLYASMLPSGADATNSLAILSSGSINNFVDKMNELVSKLGLNNTHFVNVTGLDADEHYSTSDDMRKILQYALKNEEFKKIYTTREYKLSNGLIVNSTINTYNKNNIIDTSKIIGSKTGFTLDAGYCLSSLSNINSHEFIIIVLNADHKDNKYYNILDTVNLINFLIDNYQNQILVNKGDPIKKIPIELSKIDNYTIKAKEDVVKYLPSDYDINDLKIKYNGLEKLSYRNKKGDQIGVLEYSYKDKVIKQEKIILNKDIDLSIKKLLKKYIVVIVIIIVLLIFIIIKFVF